jgi:hypothetical protein
MIKSIKAHKAGGVKSKKYKIIKTNPIKKRVKTKKQ